MPNAKLVFGLLWFSEAAFDLGAALVSFAVGVWVFRVTGSATDYSWSILSATFSAMLMAPVAGTLADRYDRRSVVACCDAAAIVSAASVAWLVASGRLAVPHLYIYAAAMAAIGAVRRPAIRVAVSSVVSMDGLARAGGLSGVSRALVQVGAPSAAGFLMGAYGLQSIMAVELTLVAAGGLLVFAALTKAGTSVRGLGAGPGATSIVGSAKATFSGAWEYLEGQPLMAGLLGYGAALQSMMVLVTTMFTPMVLSTHPTQTLGTIMSIGIVGGLSGSIVVTTSLIRRRWMLWVLGCDVLQSATVLLAGWSTSVTIWCACAFACSFAGSTSVACSTALWMRKGPLARQGSLFALLTAINVSATSLALLAGSHLAASLIEPALAPGGAWSNSVGVWFGTGKGRGFGFLFVLCGAGSLLLTTLALGSRRLRELDQRVPDRAEKPA